MITESVGSFLPDDTLIQALGDHRRGIIDDHALEAVRDAAVKRIVESQIEAGLEYVTSGELRRDHWAHDFWFGLGGLSREHIESGRVYQDIESATDLLQVTGPVAYAEDHPFFADFEFLHKAVAGRARTRQSLPSPANLLLEIYVLSDGRPENLYPTPSTLIRDIALAYRLTALKFHSLGCRSLQYDDTALGLMCDTIYTKRLLQGGVDLLDLHEKLIEVTDSSLAGLPDDMEKSIYISGGDTIVPEWDHTAHPDNIIPKALARLDVDKYFLPFDPDNDDSLNVLTLIPDGKTVVLGLADAHSPLLDNHDAIIHEVARAKELTPGLRFAISTRTGFKLTSFSERALSYEDQWRKLAYLSHL